jgi:hypothetical protein
VPWLALADPWAPAASLEALPCSPWLPGELPDGVLEALLWELWLLEGLPLLPGGGGGGVELGVDGVWGVVGVLALGQPPSNRQTAAIPASWVSNRAVLWFDVICPDQFFGPHRLSCHETGAKFRIAQHPHQAGRRVLDVFV